MSVFFPLGRIIPKYGSDSAYIGINISKDE